MTEGEFEKRIKAFDRELLKREFWYQGVHNTLEEVKKEFPLLDDLDTYIELIEDEEMLERVIPIPERYILKWFIKWFR